MNHLDTFRILDEVRKVLGYTLYNQRLMCILNKISFIYLIHTLRWKKLHTICFFILMIFTEAEECAFSKSLQENCLGQVLTFSYRL